MFARIDANKDGKVDAADREAARAAMQAKRFASFDANSDGSISKTEWDQHGADRQAKRAEWKEKRAAATPAAGRSEEHTSELQSLMRSSYAVFCLKKKKTKIITIHHIRITA